MAEAAMSPVRTIAARIFYVVKKETRNMSEKWHGGKGDKRRPAQVSKQEQDLRWELMFCKNKKRKEAIKRELERLQREI